MKAKGDVLRSQREGRLRRLVEQGRLPADLLQRYLDLADSRPDVLITTPPSGVLGDGADPP